MPLYPISAPRARHSFALDGGHEVEVREHGLAQGPALLVLHGGPGSGGSPLLHRYADPARWRIVCIDQRGSGASRPRGGTEANTLAHLLDDLRRVRRALGIERWTVVGGSWGATLAIAHAADEPAAVSALLLRSAFLARDADVHAFFADALQAAPKAWQALSAPHEPPALIAWLAGTMRDGPPPLRRAAARAWWQAEQALSGAAASGIDPTDDALDALIDRYRVQSHYLVHGCFLRDRPLLARCADVPPVPTLLLHGSADRVCRPDGARALQAALPGALLQWIDGAGHDPTHPGIVDAMAAALDAWAAAEVAA